MRGYLVERQQHEQYKVQGRKRLEILSRGLSMTKVFIFFIAIETTSLMWSSDATSLVVY